MARPRIAVTLSDPARAADPESQAAKNARYLAALERAGAEPVPLLEAASAPAALATVDGLLITGGADLDPARYGQDPEARTKVDPDRDALDAAAWRAADARRVPVLGVCRGLQAINVFAGGTLVQHVEGHVSERGGAAVVRHPIRIEPASRLGRLVGDAELEVNSFHHQAVGRDGIGAGLRVAATAAHEGGTELVEALESTDADRWLVGVQCHPERTETSPPVLEALWADFVAACSRRSGTP